MNEIKFNGLMKRYSVFDVINILFMLCFLIVTIFPFIHMFSVSTSKGIYVLRGEVVWFPKEFNLDMYAYLLRDGRLLKGMFNSIIYSSLGTVISLAVTSLGAYALSKKTFTFQKFFMLAILFTMIFSGGLIPTYLTVQKLGLTNTMWAMILPTAVSTWYLIIMRTFFQNMSVEIEEAAKIDGLNDFQVFMRVVIPLSLPLFATIGLFCVVRIWNDFFSALIYIRNPDLNPLQVFVRNIVLLDQIGTESSGHRSADNYLNNESLNYAVILFSIFPILLVYPFLQKYYVQGVMIGSLKG